MYDDYYKDTKAAVNLLGSEDFSFLNKELQSNIDDVVREVDMLLTEYEEKVNLIAYYEQLLCSNDIELTTP